MSNCKHCGAPMIELFMPGSLVCKAECDLKPATPLIGGEGIPLTDYEDAPWRLPQQRMVSAVPDYSAHPTTGSGKWAWYMLQAGCIVTKIFPASNGSTVRAWYHLVPAGLMRKSTVTQCWLAEPYFAHTQDPDGWSLCHSVP